MVMIKNPEPPDALDNLRSKIGDVGGVMLQKKIAEQQRKRDLQDSVKKAILNNILSGKTQYKGQQPLNINALMEGDNYPNLGDFEPVRNVLSNKTTTYKTREQLPFDQVLKARDELSRTPKEWSDAGMAKVLGRKKGTGLFGLGYGPGSENEYQLNPEVDQILGRAKGIIENPYKESTRTVTTQQGGSGPSDTGGLQELIDEYNSTDDPARLQELEELLTQMGVQFQ